MVADLIGKVRSGATAILRAHGLTPFRDLLNAKMFTEAWPHPSPPKTILIPEVVFWLMATAALCGESMAGCTKSFWSSLRAAWPWLPAEPVQEEAFCTARNALPLRFFLRIFQRVVSAFSARFGTLNLWKGRRLLGIDGTEVDLPRHPHLRALFPIKQYGAGARPQGRLVGLVGLRDGLCYSFRWTNLDVGEQASAHRLVKDLRGGDLLLGDRNFPDLATMAGALAQGADFLFHLSSNRYLGKQWKRQPTPSGRMDEWTITLPLPAELKAQYPTLGPGITVRILHYQIKGFRPSWLITSLLNSVEFSHEELVDLYHERWCQETFHREWKHTLELSHLRSHKAKGLLKEVLVQLTLNNLIRWVMARAAGPGLYPTRLKFLETKRLVLNCLPAMAAAPATCLPWLYRQLLDDIARQRILIRPDRSYPRQWDARGKPKGHGKIAAPARLPVTEQNRKPPI